MRLPVAILAGGLATRMRPVTQSIPKSLLDVHGKPFVARQLECLAEKGAREVVLCIGHLGEMISNSVGDGGRFGLQVRYSDEGRSLLGTGGALKKALPLLGEKFLALYGDSFLDCDYEAAERYFVDSGKMALMTVYRNEGHFDASNVLFADGAIRMYDKKNRDPRMMHIDYGLGGFTARAFDAVTRGARADLAAVYQELLAKGELAGLEMFERFYEIGSPEGLAETRRYFKKKESGK